MRQVNNAQRALKALAAQREKDLARIKFWASNDPTSPASFIGGTWERIEDCTIWGASDTHPAGTKLEAGLPNITGQTSIASFYIPSAGIFTGNNAFYGENGPKPAYYDSDTGGSYVRFNASRSNSIYGRSDTVQPPAYCLYIWRRVA